MRQKVETIRVGFRLGYISRTKHGKTTGCGAQHDQNGLAYSFCRVAGTDAVALTDASRNTCIEFEAQQHRQQQDATAKQKHEKNPE